MAVTEVGTAQSDWQEGIDTSFTTSVTVPSGASLLTYRVAYYNGSETTTISSATFNGSAMTIAVQYMLVDKRVAILTLVSPAVTTANLVITFNNSNSVFLRGLANKWSNVDTATPYHDAVSANGSSSTATVNVPSVVSGEVVIDAVGAAQTLTVRAGQTQDLNGVLVTASSITGGFSQSTTTGTNTMDWTVGSSTTWATCALAIKEAASGITTEYVAPVWAQNVGVMIGRRYV